MLQGRKFAILALLIGRRAIIWLCLVSLTINKELFWPFTRLKILKVKTQIQCMRSKDIFITLSMWISA